ncbi:HNRPL protein, partial [Podargus strigoides]|nr:HNRPL protein [Podargus strigoides]
QVKFMKSKPGAAMVEMADGYAVDRAITHLNNNFMFGQKLNVWWVSVSSLLPFPPPPLCFPFPSPALTVPPQICDELGVKRPSSVKVFSGKSERSSSGLLEWDSKSDALETLGFLNHYQMKNPS